MHSGPNFKIFVIGHIFPNPIQEECQITRGIRIWRENLKKIWSLGSYRLLCMLTTLTTHTEIHINTSNILQKCCYRWCYSLSFINVWLPLPSCYLTVTVLDTTWLNVTDRLTNLPTVHQRYPSLPQRYKPLPNLT